MNRRAGLREGINARVSLEKKLVGPAAEISARGQPKPLIFPGHV
jgi:hypothetical protein